MKRFLVLLPLVLTLACSRPGGALIGITSSRSGSGATLLSSAYTEAVSKADGVPVVLPTVASAAEAEAVVAALNGIVFSGGEDINPAWYGEDVLNETVHRNPVRDHSDSLLARAALASGKPILAICRGEQLMNVMLGGSLYQDIPTQIHQTVGHGGGAVHKVGLEEKSLLAELYGTDSLEVNSFHHQCVKTPAPGIRITARSAEGVVEAFETAQITAVQFHPEKMLQSGDTRWLPFFKAFVKKCK